MASWPERRAAFVQAFEVINAYVQNNLPTDLANLTTGLANYVQSGGVSRKSAFSLSPLRTCFSSAHAMKSASLQRREQKGRQALDSIHSTGVLQLGQLTV